MTLFAIESQAELHEVQRALAGPLQPVASSIGPPPSVRLLAGPAMSVAAIPIASRKPTTSNTRLVISLSPSRLRRLAAFGREHHHGLADMHD